MSQATNQGKGEGDSTPNRKIYVSGLGKECDEDALQAKISRHGEIVDIIVIRDSAGASKGFGFVEFKHFESAAAAITDLNEISTCGIRAAYALPRRKRTNGAQEARAERHYVNDRKAPERLELKRKLVSQLLSLAAQELLDSPPRRKRGRRGGH